MAFPKGFEPKVTETTDAIYTMKSLQKDGSEIKIRFMSDFIVGYETWKEDNGKRIVTRVRENEPMPAEAVGVNQWSGEPEMIRQFIAAIVWNYTTEQAEIFCTTNNRDLIAPLAELEDDSDYGDVTKYDIKIKRTGTKTETKYFIKTLSKEPVADDIKLAVEEANIDLKGLYSFETPNEYKKPFTEQMDEEIDLDSIPL